MIYFTIKSDFPQSQRYLRTFIYNNYLYDDVSFILYIAPYLFKLFKGNKITSFIGFMNTLKHKELDIYEIATAYETFKKNKTFTKLQNTPYNKEQIKTCSINQFT